MVQEAVVRAKGDWVDKVGEAAKRAGQVRWGSICRLQRTHSGHRPVKTAAVLKTDGELTKGPEEVIDHWYEHFKNLLNIRSIYDEEVVAAVPTLPPLLQYDEPPTLEELQVEFYHVTTRMFGGPSSIKPEFNLDSYSNM